MRNHVFPVCELSFKKVTVTGVLGDEKTWKRNANRFHFQDDEKEIEIGFRGPGVSGDGTLNKISILNSEYISEYLIDYTDEVDIPEGGNSSEAQVQTPTDFFSYYFLEDTLLSQIKENNPKAGSVLCFGLKVGDLYNGVEVELRTYRSSPSGEFLPSRTPFSDDASANALDKAKVDLNKNAWVTVMFTGTRWVILGSNNWVS